MGPRYLYIRNSGGKVSKLLNTLLDVEIIAYLNVFLCVNRTPFVETAQQKGGENNTYERIKQHTPPLFPLPESIKNDLFSDDAKAIVDSLLSPDPNNRGSAELLLSSPWLHDDDVTS